MKSYKKIKSKISWYYAPAFLLFWFVLFFAVVLPVFFYLPDGLDVDSEQTHQGQFIAERAERILFEYEIIGPKVVGSFANENQTLQLLIDEVEKIKRAMHQDLFQLEVDVQEASGAYMHWQMINMYQGLQNLVVKLSSKNSTSESYFLINSHFDAKPGSPGAGDDGAMVVVMLETLRVLATTRQTFQHPIVFLFNGAEENPLQGSHAFITQHKWAKNCKALINLDSAGSGHREILFQSGPNHPWLIDYYRKHVKRPYCTTLAEELFESNIIPSDTDFRIFKNFGKVPGLDLAHTYNGYVYHTKFDKMDVIPRGTLQVTGEHVLALTRAFSNSTELIDPSKYADGNVVFFDWLGQFMLSYSETQGKIINTCLVVVLILLAVVSFWLMASQSFMSIGNVMRIFGIIFVIHIISFVLGFGLPILMAVLFDSGDRSMSWFANKWLVLGLYICPSLFGLSGPTLLYLSFSRNDKISKPFRLQMVLHSHSILLAVICIVITFMGIRSSYLLMISLFFYTIALLVNLITTLHNRGYYWMIIFIISQIMPFMYFTYLFQALSSALMPMMGRFGTAANPDLYISILVALGTVLAMGFVIPLINIFRKPMTILLSLVIVTFIFSMIAITSVGFPYRAKTNVGRINYMQVQRVFYEYDGSVSRNESGFYFDFQDRYMEQHLRKKMEFSKMESVADDCDSQMMCGIPLFNHRWYKARRDGKWLPSEKPFSIPGVPNITLLSKTINDVASSVEYQFELSGPSHMSIFISPLEGTKILDWSFLRSLLQSPEKWQPPYHIYFCTGNDKSPLIFTIELQKQNGKFDEPIFELGISGHYVSNEHERDEIGKTFLKSFPDYVFIMEWPSSYERYIF